MGQELKQAIVMSSIVLGAVTCIALAGINRDSMSQTWGEWNPLRKKGDFYMVLPLVVFGVWYVTK